MTRDDAVRDAVGKARAEAVERRWNINACSLTAFGELVTRHAYDLGVSAGLEEAAVIADAEEERLSLDSARYDAEATAERLAAAIRRRKGQPDE